MTKRWRLYWSSIALVVFGVSLWSNRRRYPTQQKSWLWLSLKSLVDSLLIGLAAWKCPAILFGLSIGWMTSFWKKDHAWKGVWSCLLSMILASVGLVCFEIVLIAGIFGIDVLTKDLFAQYQELRFRDSSRQDKAVCTL